MDPERDDVPGTSDAGPLTSGFGLSTHATQAPTCPTEASGKEQIRTKPCFTDSSVNDGRMEGERRF